MFPEECSTGVPWLLMRVHVIARDVVDDVLFDFEQLLHAVALS